jgi:hypothetical protein
MKNLDSGSIKRAARVAGLIYLLQIPLGVFGILYVQKSITVVDNIPETVNNILENEGLVRLSIVSAILAALVTVFTALQLYKVLGRVSKVNARLMVIFTIIAAPIAILNELNHVAVLILSHKVADQDLSQISLFLNLHEYGLHFAGLFWGLWLLPMGWLVYRSGFIPKVIGLLLIAGAVGYLADFGIFTLLPASNLVISQFTFIGEVLMVFWLLIKGINEQKFKNLINNI